MSARDVMLPVIEDHPREDTLADTILSALSAAGYVVEQGWQDIATAPRDGVAVIVLNNRGQFAAQWDGDWWAVDDGKFEHPLRGNEPTHWRPLPAPPAQEPTP